ncbi:MAG: MG2 domain-containing protein, partial [Planctomycetales bacterium]
LGVEHYGYMIAGKFRRGQHRGGGKVVNAVERDRVRALQLMTQAMPLAKQNGSPAEVADFYLGLARMLLNNRGHADAWRLQTLTNLDESPDHEDGWGYYGRNSGAPVDENGEPVFHSTPPSWEAAKTDGQRWRFALAAAMKSDPRRKNTVRMQFGNFLFHQFGAQTMQYHGSGFFGRRASNEDADENESGTYDLRGLQENETIARLASGVKRFKLPDEFNFIRVYQEIAADDATGHGDQAIHQLAQIHENRRQYPQAAKYWRTSIAKYRSTPHKQSRLQQIIGKWGRFEPVSTHPAGEGPTVEYRFRNGREVVFEAHEIDARRLLGDVKAYLKSSPAKLDWNHLNLGNLGYRLVQKNQQRYVGRSVAQWTTKLNPRTEHLDKRISVATPLQNPGAYLLTASMTEGNVSKIVLWVDDTVIVKKPLQGKALYYVADAVTGKPVANANLELFGYRQRNVGRNQYKVDVRQTMLKADQDGQAFHAAGEDNNRFQWIATATTNQGRFAFLGYTHVWNANYHDAQYNQVKVFSITDRPVYRPQQKVHFKFWVRRAQYDQEDVSQFAGREFTVEIHNPKGDKVLSRSMTADEFGGLEGEYDLPEDAALGVYRCQVLHHGGGSFRVEEYKKPEFEVLVQAPSEPVMLGEKITATIQAKYYFGSPVAEGKVKYKVMRTSHDDRWYPAGDWDWLYGKGYWWFAADSPWYPGWERWGCESPAPWWHGGRGHVPPEMIADVETKIRPDGTVEVEIDTALAKAIHPDQDHRYQIIAEVVDNSRRVIVGTGKVLVARRPFKVFTWLDRGYYRVNDSIEASFSARTLDSKPVQGKGKLTLFKITYEKNNKPVETPVQTWDVDADEEGFARKTLKASEAGQYRASYTLTDAKNHSIEGGCLFTVVGDGFNGDEFRFNDLEIITDQREYKPGETVKLQINVNRSGSTVLLFSRPSNGVYLPPRTIRMKGKSAVVPIAVAKKDMPNFFVEAVAVARGKVHSQVREVVVPPEKRVLNVKIEPTSETYRPGEKAAVAIKLTDFQGEPFAGSAVGSIYDKSVEYVSGGSNVPEIKSFFCKWRRRHYMHAETSLGRWFGNATLLG